MSINKGGGSWEDFGLQKFRAGKHPPPKKSAPAAGFCKTRVINCNPPPSDRNCRETRGVVGGFLKFLGSRSRSKPLDMDWQGVFKRAYNEFSDTLGRLPSAVEILQFVKEFKTWFNSDDCPYREVRSLHYIFWKIFQSVNSMKKLNFDRCWSIFEDFWKFSKEGIL